MLAWVDSLCYEHTRLSLLKEERSPCRIYEKRLREFHNSWRQKQQAIIIVFDSRCSAAKRRKRAALKLQSYRVRTSYCWCVCESFTFPVAACLEIVAVQLSRHGHNPALRCDEKWPLTLHGGCRLTEWRLWTNAEHRLSERIPLVKHRLSCSAPSLLTNTHPSHRRASICKVNMQLLTWKQRFFFFFSFFYSVVIMVLSLSQSMLGVGMTDHSRQDDDTLPTMINTLCDSDWRIVCITICFVLKNTKYPLTMYNIHSLQCAFSFTGFDMNGDETMD